MTIETTTVETTVATTPAAKPKYLVQREKRQRFSFGDTWLNAVLAGVVTDQPKLVAHGVKVNAGTQAELEALSFDELLARVQAAIFAEPAPTVEPEVEVEVEVEAPAIVAEVEEVAVEEAEEVAA